MRNRPKPKRGDEVRLCLCVGPGQELRPEVKETSVEVLEHGYALRDLLSAAGEVK